MGPAPNCKDVSSRLVLRITVRDVPEVEITNRGYGCSTSTAPTFTLTDGGGVCGGGATMAEFTLRCEEGQDTTGPPPYNK